MMVKKEIVELIKKLRCLEIGSSEWEGVMNIFKKKYKMNSYSILSLFASPPVVEYTLENRHLLLEKEIEK